MGIPKIQMYGSTDIGKVRRINEDSFQLIPAQNVVVVCDGMGGHAAGEVASRRAVETVAAYLQRCELPGIEKLPGWDQFKIGAEAVDMVHAIRLANRGVFLTAEAQKSMRGMGTTLVAVRFHGNEAIVCHVGDSRAYRLSEGTMTPLTVDHSLLAELKAHGELTEEQERNFPERNVITRALGTRPSVAVDVHTLTVRKGDWVMLCSDGLCGYIEDSEIERVMKECYPDAQRAIDRLIETANAAGGHDNVTVAIAAVDESGGTETAEEVFATISEATEDETERELAVLRELDAALQAEAAKEDLENTDKIRIIAPVAAPSDTGSPQPPAPGDSGPAADEVSEPKRKRGFWPWSQE